ncbi:NADH-quinone oxidoreductase subunit K [Candidatus Bathyarchaeota archaeon]|nr:NADH-quinone oxidoreductase subunit K [Candidatus Bathyarchaeota archaeon]
MVEVWQTYMACSFILTAVGLYTIISMRNMIRTIIGIEIITIAVNLNFLALGSRNGFVDSLAQSIVFISTVIGAAVAAIALSLIINVYRHYGTLDLKKLRRLRW